MEGVCDGKDHVVGRDHGMGRDHVVDMGLGGGTVLEVVVGTLVC